MKPSGSGYFGSTVMLMHRMTGVYLDAGTEVDKTALPCVVGAREDDEKELFGTEPRYRESKESWAGTLRDLRNRGLEVPIAAARDGALGLWAGLEEVYLATEHQRSWNHRSTTMQAKLPKSLQKEVRHCLREMAEAPKQKECVELWDRYVAELLTADQRAAAETELRDWEDFVTFYHYPREHWVPPRTTNPLESVFSGIRLRTDATRRMRRRDNALYSMFKIVELLRRTWRDLNGKATLMTLILEGCMFKDAILPLEKMPEIGGARS